VRHRQTRFTTSFVECKVNELIPKQSKHAVLMRVLHPRAWTSNPHPVEQLYLGVGQQSVWSDRRRCADRGLSCERPKDGQFRATSGREPVMRVKLRFLGWMSMLRRRRGGRGAGR
jgi:hypothetical protein